MVDEYYLIYEKGEWKYIVPNSETKSEGKTVLRTFERKQEALEYAKMKTRKRNARLVENARKGYTMNHYNYKNGDSEK